MKNFTVQQWQYFLDNLVELDLLEKEEAHDLLDMAAIGKQSIEEHGTLPYKIDKLNLSDLATYLAIFSYLLDFQLPVEYQ